MSTAAIIMSAAAIFISVATICIHLSPDFWVFTNFGPWEEIKYNIRRWRHGD